MTRQRTTSSSKTPALSFMSGLVFTAFGFLAIPINASANDDYDTAIACAGSLDFLASVLPAGSEPAEDALSRGAIWHAHAKSLNQKSASDVKTDIRASSEKTKGLMMGGDQAAAAAYLGPLNESCATLPVSKPAAVPVPNPFEIDDVTKHKNYDMAVLCAGTHALASLSEDDALEKYDTFSAFASRSRPDLELDAIQSDIVKASSEWMEILLNDEALKGAGIIALCNKGLANLN